jgi:hypothetical protein
MVQSSQRTASAPRTSTGRSTAVETAGTKTWRRRLAAVGG